MSDLMMPEWFKSVPIFSPTDTSFDVRDYFENDFDDRMEFESHKDPIYWIKLEETYKDFSIFVSWDEDKVLVSDGCLTFETTKIEFGHDWEDEAQTVAQTFIDALFFALSSPGQLPLPFEVSV